MQTYLVEIKKIRISFLKLINYIVELIKIKNQFNIFIITLVNTLKISYHKIKKYVYNY